ncbi:MAG TPA: YitT family protein [Roseiflexaceae bacterium]|nr:YitT family protein [Roseiflexaceae bacterium]
MLRKIYPVLRDYLLMTIGAVMVAASVNMFLAPNNVVIGGVTGAAMLLNTFASTPVGLVTLLVNVPLFIIGFRRLGGLVFGLRTLYATAVMSLAIDLLAPFMGTVTADPLLYTLYGGLLDGIGVGLVFRARGTTGGIDIVAQLLERRFAIQPGQSMLAMNVAVFGGALLVYGPEKTLYAVLAAFIGSRALDYTLAAGSGARQALIITTKPEAITRALLHELGRGVTLLEGYGGYTGADRAVLLSVVARHEISFLKEIVCAADPQAFAIIGEASEVLGEGFRPFAPQPAPQRPAARAQPAEAEQRA